MEIIYQAKEIKTAQKEKPPPMRLTKRDSQILEAIHAFDGMLADYQIQRLFFTGKRQMQHRMRLLNENGIVDRPGRKQRLALPSMVYWLSREGAKYLAGLSGYTLKSFKYRREPKWFTLKHDLAVNDFRLDVVEACLRNEGYELESWIPEGEFWARPDKVEYKLPSGKRKSRYIRPDGFFSILSGGQRFKFLLEIDMATEDNPRFVRQKVLPGLTYLKSKAYEGRFGSHETSRWLVVTTGKRRMENMLKQAYREAGDKADSFLFATFGDIGEYSLLNSPIWQSASKGKAQSLIV